MKLKRKTYSTSRDKTIDFIIGVLGWHLINGAMLFALFGLAVLLPSSSSPGSSLDLPNLFMLTCYSVAFLVNIGGVIFLAFVRRWIALGALASIGFYLVLALLGGLLIAVLCSTYLIGSQPG